MKDLVKSGQLGNIYFLLYRLVSIQTSVGQTKAAFTLVRLTQ